MRSNTDERSQLRILAIDYQNVNESSTMPNSTTSRFVGEVRPDPPLDLLDRLPFAARVAGNLILPEPPHREVLRLRVPEIEAADARRRNHRRVIGQRNPGVARAEQREQFELLAVVGTRRITKRRPDAAVGFVHELF